MTTPTKWARRSIIRALRTQARLVNNNFGGWRDYYLRLIKEIERGEIVIEEKEAK